jgi:hypothetical protein
MWQLEVASACALVPASDNAKRQVPTRLPNLDNVRIFMLLQ